MSGGRGAFNHNDDRYWGIYGGRRVVLVHPDDAVQAGLTKDQLVDIVSTFEGEERRADKSRIPTSKSVVVRLTPSG